MGNVKLECLYCGNIWATWIWGDGNTEGLSCSKCKDKNLKTHRMSDVYGYTDQTPREDAYVKKLK